MNNIKIPSVSGNFTELWKKNSDTVCWIKVEGTKVNYPVVQTDDNKYYLTHSFNKRNNSGGWVYADFRADFTNFGKNTIIYAHNLTNRTMFGSLVETQKSYSIHKNIYPNIKYSMVNILYLYNWTYNRLSKNKLWNKQLSRILKYHEIKKYI